MGAEIAVELTAHYFFALCETQGQTHRCLCCGLTDKVVAIVLHRLHYRLYYDVQTANLIGLVVLDEVPYGQDLHVFAELPLDLDYAVHDAEDYLDVAEEDRIELLVVEPAEFLRNFHPVFETEVTLLESLVGFLEDVEGLSVPRVCLEGRILNDNLELFVQFRNVELVDFVIDDICELHSDKLRGLLLVLIKYLEFTILRHDTVQKAENKYLPAMVPLIILLYALHQLLHAL